MKKEIQKAPGILSGKVPVVKEEPILKEVKT